MLRQTRKRVGFAGFFFFIFLLISPTMWARTFRFATITPENSPWTNAFREFAGIVEKETSGRVRIKVYAGGIAGEEGDVLRKIKIGQIDGAVLSALGMAGVAPSSLVMSLPFLIRDIEQLNQVIAAASELFDEEASENGYRVLSWAFSGWVHLFSKLPIVSVEDLSNTTLAVGNSDIGLINAWQALGTKVQVLAFLDTPTGLQNGLVDTFYSSPTGAVAYQWFALAKNMTEIPLAPLTGGVILDQRKWKRISKEDQQLILELSAQMSQKFQTESVKLDQKAKTLMLANGLTIPAVNDEQRQQWRESFAESYPLVVGEGKQISSQLYENVLQLLQRN